MASASIFSYVNPKKKKKMQRPFTNNTEYYSEIIVLLGHTTPGQGNKKESAVVIFPDSIRTVNRRGEGGFVSRFALEVRR